MTNDARARATKILGSAVAYRDADPPTIAPAHLSLDTTVWLCEELLRAFDESDRARWRRAKWQGSGITGSDCHAEQDVAKAVVEAAFPMSAAWAVYCPCTDHVDGCCLEWCKGCQLGVRQEREMDGYHKKLEAALAAYERGGYGT